MSAKGLEFHHLGMAVRRPEVTRACLRHMGYQLGEAIYDHGQKAYVQMCTSDLFPNIELVYTEDAGGPVARFMETQDEVIYHICFQTKSIEAAVQAWRESGTRVFRVKAELPAPLFENRLVGFYHVQGMGLVELLEAVRPDGNE